MYVFAQNILQICSSLPKIFLCAYLMKLKKVLLKLNYSINVKTKQSKDSSVFSNLTVYDYIHGILIFLPVFMRKIYVIDIFADCRVLNLRKIISAKIKWINLKTIYSTHSTQNFHNPTFLLFHDSEFVSQSDSIEFCKYYICRPLTRIFAGISCRSFSFLAGNIILLIPALCAARTFSLIPPTCIHSKKKI